MLWWTLLLMPAWAGKKPAAPVLTPGALVAPNVPLAPPVAPVHVGGNPVTAEVCRLDGGAAPLHRTGTRRPAVRAIQPTREGGLWVLDHEASLRKYRPPSGASCDLLLDTTFGTGGVLPLGVEAADDYTALAVTATGAVVVSSDGYAVPLRVDGGKVTPACPGNNSKRLVRQDVGQSRATWDGKLVDLDAGCAGDPIVLPDWPDNLSFATVVPDADGLLVWGGVGGVNTVARFGAGGAKEVMFGAREGEGSFSFVREVEHWGTRYAVLDSNLRAVSLWSGSGEPSGTILLRDLGVDSVVVQDMARVGDSVWVAVDYDPDAMHQELFGAILRLRGL